MFVGIMFAHAPYHCGWIGLTSFQGQETSPELAESGSKDVDDESILDRSAREIAELLKEKAKLEKVKPDNSIRFIL